MTDIRTFSSFKDWALMALLGGIITMQFAINRTVNILATNDAVKMVLIDQIEKRQTKLERDVADWKRDQDETKTEVVRIKEYIKPDEIREQRKTVNR